MRHVDAHAISPCREQLFDNGGVTRGWSQGNEDFCSSHFKPLLFDLINLKLIVIPYCVRDEIIQLA